MEREGYSFMGYTSSPGGEVIWAAGDTIIATYGLHIYAVWQKLTYTVHFNSLGGTSVADKKGVGWADRNLLAGVATPKKNGYTFDGWYIIDPNADLVDDSIHKVSNPSMYSTIARYNGLTDLTALEPGVTLYAKWLENVYEIQYKAAQIDKFGNFIDTNGGTVTVKKETVRIITQVEAPNGSAARTGHRLPLRGLVRRQRQQGVVRLRVPSQQGQTTTSPASSGAIPTTPSTTPCSSPTPTWSSSSSTAASAVSRPSR